MKKATIETMIAYLNGADVDTAELMETLQSELNHINEKANANRTLYDIAHDVVMNALSTNPITCADLYEKIKDELPEGFSRSKVQYGLLNMWSAEVIKHDNGKAANTYSLTA